MKEKWTEEIPIDISGRQAFKVTNEMLKHLIYLKEKTERQEMEIEYLKRQVEGLQDIHP